MVSADVVLQRTADALLHVNRLGHIRRCLGACKSLSRVLEKVKGGGGDGTLRTALLIESSTVAALLTSKRFYMTAVDSAVAEYDPRLLVFEFLHNLVLRDSQVRLIHQFMTASAEERGALVHQLIMGAGKTTVVGPILALMLADRRSLVIEVVPRALLEMSRGILRERFSALIRKPVYTFRFDRFRKVEMQLYRKLVHARDAGAILCSTPTDIKAFMLKFVELLHVVDRAKTAHVHESDLLEIRAQLNVCVCILQLFRRSAFLMDEVDLILHPLKSELNFPVGEKEPLDLTLPVVNKVSGTVAEYGLRWEIPFHLLDALFFATGQKVSGIVDVEGSRAAETLLLRVKTTVEEGISLNAIQMEPHFVLLSRAFYNLRLKSILAEWMLIWFSLQQKSNVRDEDVL